MVTFHELRDAQPGRLSSAAAEWQRLAEKMKSMETRVINDLVKPLRNSGWGGGGAESAFRTFDKLDDEFELTARQVRNVSILIGWARTEFDKVQKALQDVIAAVGRDGLRINERGEVQDPPGYVSETTDPAGAQRYRELIARARAYNEQIRQIVYRATQLDGDVARVLVQFEPRNPGQMAAGEFRDSSFDARSALELMGMRERDIPGPDATPAQNRQWWDRLTDEQRALYLAAHPERVGALDGLAAQTRHDANMTALRNTIESGAVSEGPTGRLTSLLDRVEASEYGPEQRRLYLLGINNQLDGRGIVAIGNPDTAKHLGVAVVPGITVSLDDMNAEIDRAERIRQTADDLTPAVQGDVAVIAWVGYDTPDTIATAPFHGYADRAAPGLDRFVDGTLVAQEAVGTQSHRTIIGHSYGSTVVGLAASQGNGLAVHDIIVAGSPGMRVDNVNQLNIDPRHVWAGNAGLTDPVPTVGPLSHSTAPHSEAFGANRFHVDVGGHTHYWREGSESLRNQAHIMMGQYDRVTLDHGRPPR